MVDENNDITNTTIVSYILQRYKGGECRKYILDESIYDRMSYKNHKYKWWNDYGKGNKRIEI